jgi:hypothetical protein
MTLLPPTPCAPEAWLERRRGCHLPSQADGQGHWGQITRAARGLASKAPGRRITDAKPPTPLGFSPLHRLCLRRERRGKERAAAAPGKGGAGSEEPELRRTTAGVDIYTAENAYITLNIFATPPSTPSRPRLHHRPTVSTARPLYSLLPLGLFPVMDRRCRDASPVRTCLDASHQATGLPYRDGGGS